MKERPAAALRPARASDGAVLLTLSRRAGLKLDVSADLERNHRRIWVATRADDVPCGLVASSDLVDEVELTDLAVDEAHRRRGIARSLVERVVDEARSLGKQRLLLEVRSKNLPAVALYRQLGFEVLHTRTGYYRDPVDDALMMAHAL
jgi:ribosomal-protein-alanine N-acetyltransferase